MTDITTSDLDRAQTQGRLVACTNNSHAFNAAAENLALCLLEENGGNYRKLYFAFEEGSRNYADNQRHQDDIMESLAEEAKKIYERNK